MSDNKDTDDLSDNYYILNNSLDDLLDSDQTDHSKHQFSILQFTLNCFLHITILFFFLFYLFTFLIAPAAQNGFKSEFNHIIHDLIDHTISEPIDLDTMSDSELDTLLLKIPGYNSLDSLSKLSIKLNIKTFYTLLKKNPYIIKNYIKEYSSPNFLIKQHNDDIYTYGYAIILFLTLTTIILCCVFKYFYPTDINLSKLIIENSITFIFIGIGEYWFFTNYALKFIPAAPSLLSNTAIDTIIARFTH
jgi:hypothetical protein